MKFSHKYQDIITTKRLLQAWQIFLNGKKKRSDVIIFQTRLIDNVFRLYEDLVSYTYVHGSYHAFRINDPKPREIHKALVRDRLLHHLLYDALYPYFDTQFIYDSYSCRLNKGTHKALGRFQKFGRIVSKNHTRTCWILKCDIRKFFASINHQILKHILTNHIEDKNILWLLWRVIDSFHTEGRQGTGLPLGNLTSQLLVNIYMNKFDQWMKHVMKTEHYIRYADDFVIFSENKDFLLELTPKIADFLEEHLRLSLHPDKVFIKTLASGIDFLGWIHFTDHRVLRTATKRRMLRNVEDKFNEQAVVQSYFGLLNHGNAKKLQTVLTVDAAIISQLPPPQVHS